MGSGGEGWVRAGLAGWVFGSGSSSSEMSRKKRALHLCEGAHFSSQLLHRTSSRLRVISSGVRRHKWLRMEGVGFGKGEGNGGGEGLGKVRVGLDGRGERVVDCGGG